MCEAPVIDSTLHSEPANKKLRKHNHTYQSCFYQNSYRLTTFYDNNPVFSFSLYRNVYTTIHEKVLLSKILQVVKIFDRISGLNFFLLLKIIVTHCLITFIKYSHNSKKPLPKYIL